MAEVVVSGIVKESFNETFKPKHVLYSAHTGSGTVLDVRDVQFVSFASPKSLLE